MIVLKNEGGRETEKQRSKEKNLCLSASLRLCLCIFGLLKRKTLTARIKYMRIGFTIYLDSTVRGQGVEIQNSNTTKSLPAGRQAKQIQNPKFKSAFGILDLFGSI